jgi:hypothetical protein
MNAIVATNINRWIKASKTKQTETALWSLVVCFFARYTHTEIVISLEEFDVAATMVLTSSLVWVY